MKNREEHFLNFILYYLLAPLPATFIVYRVFLVTGLILANNTPGLFNYYGFLQSPGLFYTVQTARWTKGYTLIAFGACLGAILFIPSSKRRNLAGFAKWSLVIRANCVAIITVFLMNVVEFMNPLRERQLVSQQFGLIWAEVLAGIIVFLVAQKIFMQVRSSEKGKGEKESRGSLVIESGGLGEEVYMASLKFCLRQPQNDFTLSWDTLPPSRFRW